MEVVFQMVKDSLGSRVSNIEPARCRLRRHPSKNTIPKLEESPGGVCVKVKAICIIAMIATTALARQQPASVKTVEVTPNVLEAEVSQQLKLTAVAKDESGKTVDVKPPVWFAAP